MAYMGFKTLNKGIFYIDLNNEKIRQLQKLSYFLT